jgi:HD-like signal output (HDOD) protein/DNA-binding NarL/FixJ family response regulator
MDVLLFREEGLTSPEVQGWLQDWKMNPALVHDFEDAWSSLRDSKFDLILAETSGLGSTSTDFVRQIRGEEASNGLPILLVADRAEKSDIVRAARPVKAEALKRKIASLHREHRRILTQRTLQRLWDEQTRSMLDVQSPHIVFGEAVESLTELSSPEHRRVAEYFTSAGSAISFYNQSRADAQIGYVIKDSTSDIMTQMRKGNAEKWVRLILLSTGCHGNPTLIVRLLAINKAEDVAVMLVYDKPDDVPKNHRTGLRKLGVKTAKRSSLDAAKFTGLIENYVARDKQAKAGKREVLTAQEIHRRVVNDLDTMTRLPPLPQVYERILLLSRDPDSDLHDWIKVIKVDPLTCAVILRHANSLSHGFVSSVTEVDRAIILLGKESIAGLVASEAVRQTLEAVSEVGFDLEDFWMHNLAVGFAAYILSISLDASDSKAASTLQALGLADDTLGLMREIDLPSRVKLDHERENPFVGGILHDIGKGVMVQSYPGLFGLITQELEAQDWKVPMAEVERAVAGGLSHTVVGEILVRKWGLGDDLANVVLYHHRPHLENSFTFLIGLADIIGQAIYPFPRHGKFPIVGNLTTEDLIENARFLPHGFLHQDLIQVDSFSELARAIVPKVRFLTEKMRRSV